MNALSPDNHNDYLRTEKKQKKEEEEEERRRRKREEEERRRRSFKNPHGPFKQASRSQAVGVHKSADVFFSPSPVTSVYLNLGLRMANTGKRGRGVGTVHQRMAANVVATSFH